MSRFLNVLLLFLSADSERTTVLYIILSVIGSVLPIGLLLLILFWFLQKR